MASARASPPAWNYPAPGPAILRGRSGFLEIALVDCEHLNGPGLLVPILPVHRIIQQPARNSPDVHRAASAAVGIRRGFLGPQERAAGRWRCVREGMLRTAVHAAPFLIPELDAN